MENLTGIIKNYSDAYLNIVDSNMKLIDELKEARTETVTITKQNQRYIITLVMHKDHTEKTFDITRLIDLIKGEGPELLVKLLRQVHHNYSVMNITEMSTQLNKHLPTLNNYSESIPNELYIIKELADSIENIREWQQ